MKKIKTLIALVLTACLLLPVFGVAYSEAAEGKWVSTWSTSIVNSSVSAVGLNLQDVIPSKSTLRTELTVSVGGSALRFCFSNQYGRAPITINEATVAKTDSSAAAKIFEETSKTITFDSEESVTIQPGEFIFSDPIYYTTAPLDKLSVSLFFENTTYMTSSGLSNARTYLSMGSTLLRTPSRVETQKLPNATEVNIGSGAITYHTSPFLARIDTLSSEQDASTAVFIGDSTLVNDAALYYATRLVKSGVKNVGVINQAVIGNKLLSNGSGLIGNLYGEALLTRFSRDVLEVPGVKYCFVKIGLNDILHQFTKSMEGSVLKASTNDIINGYKKLIKLAHQRGIKIYFFTKSPWNGYERSFLGQTGDLTWCPEAQAMCDELDKWLKSDNGSDGCIDCSPLANPADRTKLCPSFTPDGAHLTEKGAIALADLIPLEFAGGSSNGAKTVAEIKGIDPYTEKRKIQKELKKAEQKPKPTEAPTQETTTAAPEETTSEQVSTQPDATEALPSQIVMPVEIPSDFYTEPSYPVPYSGVYSSNPYNAAPVDYNVNDITSEKVGTDKPIGFMLFLFTAIAVAGALVVLTVFKKREPVAAR